MRWMVVSAVSREHAAQVAQMGFFVDVARDNQDAVKNFAGPPHAGVVLRARSGMDVPESLEACRVLRRRKESPCIVVMTPRGDLDARLRAFDAGADDVLADDVDSRELAARLGALLRRIGSGQVAESGPRPTTDPAPLTASGLTVDVMRCEAHVGGERVFLTMAQWGILVTLARETGSVVPYGRLLRAAGIQSDPDGKNLRSVIHELRGRLGAAGAMVRVTKGKGYRLCSAPPVPPVAGHDVPPVAPHAGAAPRPCNIVALRR